MSTLTIRLPDEKHKRLKALTASRKISVNKLIDELSTVALAVAEKISVLETEVFFTERGQLADMDKFKDTFYRDGGTTPSEGDEPLDHSTS